LIIGHIQFKRKEKCDDVNEKENNYGTGEEAKAEEVSKFTLTHKFIF